MSYNSLNNMPPSGPPYSPFPTSASEGAPRPYDRLAVPPLWPPRSAFLSPQPFGPSMPVPSPSMPSPASTVNENLYPGTPRSLVGPPSARSSGYGQLPRGADQHVHEHFAIQVAEFQPVYGWVAQQQVVQQTQGYPYEHAQNRALHAPRPAQQPVQPLGRTPSFRSTAVDVRNRHSIITALAVNASVGSTIAYGEPVPGAHDGDGTPAVGMRGNSNAVVSSVYSTSGRPDPNECRLTGCRQPAMHVPSLGGMIEWCSFEHRSMGMQQPGCRPCKRCKSSPRRWKDSYCCKACAN